VGEAAIRVLLVDDDEDEYVLLGDLLRAACADRFALTWESTYEGGLQAILTSGCDVCLVDYRLGARSGLDLLAEITAIPGHPQVILLTGDGDRDVDVTATQAGAADYLIKGELTAALLERSIRFAVERGRTLKALRDASDLAQSMNRAKSAFVAAMSHEIRTPMNAILGMADMLWESQLDAEQRQYVEVCRRASSGLLVLINDILDLSKIEAGHLKLESIEFDPEEVVNQSIELTAVKAREKGLALLTHLQPGVASSVMGDPTRLRQVLINLLGNAVKFTDAGEILLTARNDEEGEPGQIEFTVSDTGLGIPPERLQAIFGDFEQADASTTRKYGGTGLGLGISRRLVEAMGGGLTATSSMGKGSAFRFSIPFGPVLKESIYTAPWSFHGERILLIADNSTSALILQETFRGWGLGCDAFLSPAEALARLPGAMTEAPPYSLAVIDISVPGQDDFEVVERIKLTAGGLPIVMLTSDVRPGGNARGVEAGLSRYAIKPTTRGDLRRLVGEAMEARNLTVSVIADREKQESVRSARILVAEDSQDNSLLVQVYLKARPYDLTFEKDGKAAVNRFSISDFDLILMDLQMPVMDGLAATRAIRAIERERGAAAVPIIALTADASLEDVQRSGNAGCNAHLTKPISKPALLNAIEKYRRQSMPAGERLSV
jgi:two-component system sensor histidine kinase/response regulator